MDDLVTVEWLRGQAGAPDLRVLDATYLPFEPERDAGEEYQRGHIPGARFLDLATLVDPASELPATVPPPKVFSARMGALGVTRHDRIVLYDDSPHRTSARAWWLLRLYGAEHVAILDGGLAAWRSAGLPLGRGAPHVDKVRHTGFGARNDRLLLTLDQMRARVAEGGQILDARGAGRFTGREPDPRPSVASGHMPGARNLPYTVLFDADGKWKRGTALRAAFAATATDLSQPIAFTCGSGITAADLFFAAHLLGAEELALYDGSWSEWGALQDTPKESL